jgi:hypothetical protein
MSDTLIVHGLHILKYYTLDLHNLLVLLSGHNRANSAGFFQTDCNHAVILLNLA